ncbi:hypothetical protein CNR27_02115 [Luteimonas chenhongjianii]|uniref:Uncharacterized protein n=2 Tax=Luteimonas chenhongjianii TaxID=2006110 RepID=A0A290XB90_9GAMM|nr:hypothetical protein CNR27_02115 [Luteimonas chenhongjianii]
MLGLVGGGMLGSTGVGLVGLVLGGGVTGSFAGWAGAGAESVVGAAGVVAGVSAGRLSLQAASARLIAAAIGKRICRIGISSSDLGPSMAVDM